MRPALFLDRDGVINVDHGYVHRPDDVEFIDGIFDLVQLANAAGFWVIVVTNQAGIARGMYSEEDFRGLSEWMLGQFRVAGARIDASYHCPHHPEEGVGLLRQICACRKPAPGMLLRAIGEMGVEVAESIMVGDKASDLQAGHSAEVANLFLFRPEGATDFPEGLPPHARSICHLLDPELTSLFRT